MEILTWAFLGGVFGSALMDITETIAAMRGITSWVNVQWVCPSPAIICSED